jgi:hypothetical protein
MLAVFWMLAWLGISAKWQLRSFWTAENLMASAFYGEASIRAGFASRTLPGLALYLLVYSSLGALFAIAAGARLPRFRILLFSILFSLAWYYLTFQLIWKSMMPLVALLHSAQPTVLGHVIFGTLLARYPRYLPQTETPHPSPDETPPAEAEAMPADSSPS